MPTSTFDIAANADDGQANKSDTVTSINDATNYASIIKYTVPYEKAAWLRFTGITISKNTVITSAIIKLYNRGTGRIIKLQADAAHTPGNPVNGVAVITPTSIVSGTFPSWTPTVGTGIGKELYHLDQPDVKFMVQTLVDDYEYSSDEMVFYIRSTVATAFSYIATIYQRDWGTSKDAQLVIDYVSPAVPPPPDKTTYHHG